MVMSFTNISSSEIQSFVEISDSWWLNMKLLRKIQRKENKIQNEAISIIRAPINNSSSFISISYWSSCTIFIWNKTSSFWFSFQFQYSLIKSLMSRYLAAGFYRFLQETAASLILFL